MKLPTIACVMAVAALPLTACRPSSPATLPTGSAPLVQAAMPASPQLGPAFDVRVPESNATIRMLPIPAGRFMMGSPASEAGRKADEGPQVEVIMDGFYMAECEITWEAMYGYLKPFDRLNADPAHVKIPPSNRADAVTYPSPIYDLELGPIVERMGGREGNFPAISFSRFGARQFTKWLSKKTGRFYRLPTEAEWEYACRAGTRTAYAFGNDAAQLKSFGWYEDNSTLPDGDPGYRTVTTMPANAWGLKNMHGNVSEWVIDQYDADWYAQLAAKRRPVRWDEAIRWPTHRYPCLTRGGNYESEAVDCRSAARFKGTAALNSIDPQLPKTPFFEHSTATIGFRIVSPLVTPSIEEQNRWWNADDAKTLEGLERDRYVWEFVRPATQPTTGTSR